MSRRRARARLNFDGDRAPRAAARFESPIFTRARPDRSRSTSRAPALVISLLLAALLHACVLVSAVWQRERVPVREVLARIVLLAPDEAAAVAEQPAVTLPTPKAATRPPARRPALPSASEPSPAAPPAAEPAPSESVPHAAPSASAPAPLAGEVTSARPRYKRNPEPVYPVVARRRRQQGNVLLSVRVDSAGRPETVAIKTSSGIAALDEAAVAAVEHWEFEPGRLAGEPVASQVEVPIHFELDRD